MRKDFLDENYTNHQSTSINNAQFRTFPILQFTITINLAFYGALYVLSCENGSYSQVFSDFNIGLKFILSSIILLFNLGFGVIYYRELLINRIISRLYYQVVIPGKGNFARKWYECIERHDWQGVTGKLFQKIILLIVVLSFGFWLIFTSFYLFTNIEVIYNCIDSPINWLIFMGTALVVTLGFDKILKRKINNKVSKAVEEFKKELNINDDENKFNKFSLSSVARRKQTRKK